MRISYTILPILFSINISFGDILLPCREIQGKVCSKVDNYVSENSPEPFPTKVNILLKFYDIIGVNEADQTVTVTLKAVLEWIDSRLDVNRTQEQTDQYVNSNLLELLCSKEHLNPKQPKLGGSLGLGGFLLQKFL